MLKPQENKLIYNFFSWYICKIIRSDFSGFEFEQVSYDKSKAILVLANHFSWWDGFLIFHLNKLYFRKNFYVMITEDNYQEHSFLKYLGAFSVKKGSKSILQTLEYGGSLLDDPANLVLIFPQGKLHSAYTDDIHFEKGLLNLINSSKRDFSYVFVSTFINYFNKRKPSVRCYLLNWKPEEFISLQVLKSAYNKHFQQSRAKENRLVL